MKRLRKLLMLIGLLALPTAGIAAEPWREASSAHFVIYAQYDAAELRGFAERLERFDKALRVLRKLPDDPVGDANRVTVYVVKNNEAVAKLADAPGSDIVGFYRARAGASLAVSSREQPDHWTETSPQVVLLHEYAHHFMLRYFPAAYPAWFREGFAEFYSTARFNPDGSMEIGAPANHRAYELAVVRQPDVALMLADPGNSTGVGSMELYSYGWLLTHYLTFNEARKGQLAAYLDAINRGVPAKDASVRAFGNLKQLERDVRTYLAKRHMKVASLTRAELAIGPIAIRDLAPDEAAMLPVRMRSLLVEKAKTDRDVASDARRAAERLPQDRQVVEVLAEAELAGGNLDAAEVAADRAIALDSASLRGLLVKADVALRRAAADPAKPAKAQHGRAARATASKANRIDPDNPVPLILFYRSFAVAGDTPTPNAVTGLTRAHLLAPEDDDVWLMLAQQMIADRKVPEARILLTPIAYDPHGGKQRATASKLLSDLPPVAGAKPRPADRTSAGIPAAAPWGPLSPAPIPYRAGSMADPRIINVELDERTILWRSADIEQERRIAIFDLIEGNHFAPQREHPDGYAGPYRIALSVEEGRLGIAINREDDTHLETYVLGLGRFRRPIKDYFAICDSYYAAIRNATPAQIETVDMARRGIHNEAAELLKERLEGKIEIDFDTARRLFTLICVLHIKG